MNVISHKKIFTGLSLLLVLASLIVIGIKGLDFSIEFTGGTVIEVAYDERPEISSVQASLADIVVDTEVQPLGDDSYLVRTPVLDEQQRQNILAALGTQEESIFLERFNSIGPSVGNELQTKSLWALILVSVGIIFFVAYAFRKVSQPVSSWQYGFVAVIALLHDIIIPVGILTLLGTQVDTLYVVGLLSILGLSVNDTIVVFDRIRENLSYNSEHDIEEEFGTTVNEAIKQTVVRSLLTSLTLVVVLVTLYLRGPASTQTLSLVLLLGTLVGTYSSMFLASPLLTMLVGKKVSEK
jgi:preprotein translocase subunit SecF